jgi:hypothetical protein
MNGIEKIRKKVDALEKQGHPEVNTWKDLMIAASENREIILGPALVGITDEL